MKITRKINIQSMPEHFISFIHSRLVEGALEGMGALGERALS